MPSLFSGIRTYLKGIPELSTLTDIYGDESKPEPNFPFMVINELFEIPTSNLTDAYYTELTMQFTVQAKDKAQSRSLARAAYKALWRNRMPMIVFDDGYEMDGRERGNFQHPRAQTSGRPEGDTVWQSSFDYTFLIGREGNV